MGAAGSRVALDNPFPLDAKMNSDLDLLSVAISRILNTPDIYDINNLGRPGVCGDYAVFLRNQVEKKLLPFMATVDGKDVAVAYLNPRKSIDKPEVRKEVCKQLTGTILRVISIVVASLASIQVANQSRDTAVAGVTRQAVTQMPSQRGGSKLTTGQGGGGIPDVREWLVNNNYISAANVGAAGADGIRLNNPAGDDYSFRLAFVRTEGVITYANLSAEGGKPEPLPRGSLKVQFMNPVQIPGTTRTVLPLRVLDNAGLPWMVGVLYENVFKSLVPNSPHSSPYSIWYSLFRRTQGWEAPLRETRDQLNQANLVFSQAKQGNNPSLILPSLTEFLTQYVQGYSGAVQQPPYGAPPGYYPGAPPAPYYPGMGGPYGAPAQRAVLPLQQLPSGLQQQRPAMAPAASSMDYDIPLAASKYIYNMLNNFRNMVVKQSCPAAVRSVTLSAKLNPDRTIQTGICRDPYWLETNMGQIYPYTALQFLCYADWNVLSSDRRTDTRFVQPWFDFLSGMKSIYRGGKVPTLEGPDVGTAAVFLDQYKFKDVSKTVICESTGQNPRVRFQGVQDGLLAMQGAYSRHVKKIWEIMNSLIYVVEDPDTKQSIVRLHPKVVAAGSMKYVDGLAVEARKQIIAHYLEIETIYRDTIEKLVVA